jgi:DNA replication protein DnaC
VAAASGAETQAVLDELRNEIDRLNKENAALRQRVQLLTHRLFFQLVSRRYERGSVIITSNRSLGAWTNFTSCGERIDDINAGTAHAPGGCTWSLSYLVSKQLS